PNSELAVSLSNEVKARGGQARLISISRLENHTTPDHLAALILLASKNQDYSWYQNAYKLLQKSSAALTSSKGTFATISQLGGQFGLDALNSLDDCYAGGISALAKTIQHEWPKVTTRSIDLSFDFNDNTQRAARALDNVFKQGPLEIGVFAKRAITLKLSALTSTEQPPQKILNSGDTVLVTGGARGVTAATLKYLAKRYPVRLVIWGRTELPPEENANLNNLIEAATIKRQLLKNQPELAHPRDLERAYSQLISARELKGTLAELKAFGAEVIYEAVDVSNKDNIDRAFQSLQDRYPNIRGIIHGAGVLRDKIINDQSEDELQSVLSTKLTLLPYFEQLAKSGTQWMVFFSSSTARLGRKGQGAYGLANEILNRAASYLSTQYPTRVLSLNWGPWDGGMVNDGLKKLFASEGLGTIPLEAGAALQTYLLEHPSLGSGEWLVLGEGGEAILESHLITEDLILARRKVTIDETPVLLDHVIKNRAVVPAALLLEWMAQAAQPHYPNLKYVEAKNFQVFKGLVLDADSEVDIEIVGTHKGLVGMECILRSTSDSGMPRPHARVQLTFSETADERFTKISPYSVNDALERVEIYSKILFHGESLHLIKAIKHHDAHRLVAELRLQGEAKDWYQENHSWLTHAPLLDAVFQAAIVWSDLSLNSRCLPSRFDNAIFYQPWIPQDAILDLHIVSALDHQLKADAKVFGADGSLIADIRGFEATLDASLAESFRMRSLNVDGHGYDTQKDTE
ncbi:MAG: SDR family NAD(P)-dependent oxidoreductase, partial [Proteobacteria bacterium]